VSQIIADDFLVVFGPPIHYSKATKDELLGFADNSTRFAFWATCMGRDFELPPFPFHVWVDVRLFLLQCVMMLNVYQVHSVAKAIYEIIVRGCSGRYILYGGDFDLESLTRVARKIRPDLDEAGIIPRGKPDEPLFQKGYRVNASKAAKELGIVPQSMEETIDEYLKQLEVLGAVSVSD
jgi:hypothetical protein